MPNSSMRRAGKLVWRVVWVCVGGGGGVVLPPPPLSPHHQLAQGELATMVVCECEEASKIPELPDEIFRKILSIKHESFLMNLPAMRAEKRQRDEAQRQAEIAEGARRVAECELLSASVLATISLVVVVVFFVVLR